MMLCKSLAGKDLDAFGDIDLGCGWCIRATGGKWDENTECDQHSAKGIDDDTFLCPFGIFRAEWIECLFV